jgi:hypothetical protein
MTLSLRLASLVLGGLFVLPLHAADTDPLWTKVVARSAEGKKWIAKDVEMAIEGNHEGKLEKKRFRHEFTGWEKDKPVYKTVMIEPLAEAGKPVGQDGGGQVDSFSALSEELFKIDTKWVRKDGQQIDGKSATLFVVDSTKGPMDVKMQVWVDPANGNIHRLHTHVHGTWMMDMNLNIAYKPHASGLTMPSKTDMKLEVLVPFKGSTMQLTNTTNNWVQRPL